MIPRGCDTNFGSHHVEPDRPRASLLRATMALADAGNHRNRFLSVAGRMPLAAFARQLSAMAHGLPMVVRLNCWSILPMCRTAMARCPCSSNLSPAASLRRAQAAEFTAARLPRQLSLYGPRSSTHSATLTIQATGKAIPSGGPRPGCRSARHCPKRCRSSPRDSVR